MYLYALTYTDPSEPWGSAILDRKLYRTPTAVCDAANAHFEAWCGSLVGWNESTTRRAYFAARMVDDTWAINYLGQTLAEVLAYEYSHEYGIGRYRVVN